MWWWYVCGVCTGTYPSIGRPRCSAATHCWRCVVAVALWWLLDGEVERSWQHPVIEVTVVVLATVAVETLLRLCLN